MTSSLHVLISLAILLLVGFTSGHYNLADPIPYNRISCRVPKCLQACPPIWKTGGAAAVNSPETPSRTWSRGETVTIKWHRNNHEGGFYRRSLVPVKHMYNKEVHKRTAFEWGCWTQGRFMCGSSKACGSDKQGFAYQNTMKVPEVFPDGDYVFSMVWFGGIHFLRKRGLFSDYLSCAYVRIKGGPFVDRYIPNFVPGKNHRAEVEPGKCVSTSMFIGECGGGPCENKPVRSMIAGVFQNGNTPAPVYLKDVEAFSTPDGKESTEKKEEKTEVKKEDEKKKTDGKLVAPPAPTGGWGPKGSQLWWSKRAEWWKRHLFCLEHKDICST